MAIVAPQNNPNGLSFASSSAGGQQWGEDKSGASLGLGDLTPYNPTTRAILKSIALDAGQNGLSQWGYSVLKSLGQPIKTEWLKENSRAWFNQPLLDTAVPPEEDFKRLVEPISRTPNLFGEPISSDRGFNTLRQKYGMAVDSSFSGKENRLGQSPVALLDPQTEALRSAQGGDPSNPILKAAVQPQPSPGQPIMAPMTSGSTTNAPQVLPSYNQAPVNYGPYTAQVPGTVNANPGVSAPRVGAGSFKKTAKMLGLPYQLGQF